MEEIVVERDQLYISPIA